MFAVVAGELYISPLVEKALRERAEETLGWEPGSEAWTAEETQKRRRRAWKQALEDHVRYNRNKIQVHTIVEKH